MLALIDCRGESILDYIYIYIDYIILTLSTFHINELYVYQLCIF